MSKQKICFVTGTRAEYGLLKQLMKLTDISSQFEMLLVVTGSHLSPDHGNTITEIESDGFKISHKLSLQLSNVTEQSVSQATADVINDLGTYFAQTQPDLLVILGDRYEIFGAATAALFLKIPVAHIHGGEITEGAFDDSLRHAISKMSHLHFVSTNEYRDRVTQLGENPNYIFNVGGLGVDAIKKTILLDRDDLEKQLGIKFLKKNLLITIHPTTLEKEHSYQITRNLLIILSDLKDTGFIFTAPNADPNFTEIKSMIQSFITKHSNAYLFDSLGQQKYLSCLAVVDAVVGNSSSGILEAPSFKTPTINIGNRQKGRVQAKSVINCDINEKSISNAIEKGLSEEFNRQLAHLHNPYGSGGASEAIFNQLCITNFKELIVKKFYDIPIN